MQIWNSQKLKWKINARKKVYNHLPILGKSSSVAILMFCKQYIYPGKLCGIVCYCWLHLASWKDDKQNWWCHASFKFQSGKTHFGVSKVWSWSLMTKVNAGQFDLLLMCARGKPSWVDQKWQGQKKMRWQESMWTKRVSSSVDRLII